MKVNTQLKIHSLLLNWLKNYHHFSKTRKILWYWISFHKHPNKWHSRLYTRTNVQHKLKPICSKLLFKSLPIKLSTEVTFTFNSRFWKQTDGCTMGDPFSVTFSNIYMTKMERDVLNPFNPIFYRRYVDDIYNRRKSSKKMTFMNL